MDGEVSPSPHTPVTRVSALGAVAHPTSLRPLTGAASASASLALGRGAALTARPPSVSGLARGRRAWASSALHTETDRGQGAGHAHR